MPQEFTRVDGIIELVFSATKEAARLEAPLDITNSDASKKERKITPVKFRDACIERLQRHLKETLVRQTAAIYATPDGTTAVLSAISREYERANGAGYWFAFHPSQKEILESYKNAWVSFGCGSERQIIAIPLKEFVSWLTLFNKTELEERYYWHVRVWHEKGKWIFDAKGGEKDIDATRFLVTA
jgi:hypothetical protein